MERRYKTNKIPSCLRNTKLHTKKKLSKFIIFSKATIGLISEKRLFLRPQNDDKKFVYNHEKILDSYREGDILNDSSMWAACNFIKK